MVDQIGIRARATQLWTRFLWFPGAITLSVFVLNELLFGLVPFLWAFPYWPMRTVGLAVIGIAEIFRWVRNCFPSPNLTNALRAVTGVALVSATIWLSRAYSEPLLFDVFWTDISHPK